MSQDYDLYYNNKDHNNKSDKYKNLDPLVAKFLNELASKRGSPIYKLPIQDARKALDDLQAGSIDAIPADIQDCATPGTEDKSISIRIIRPKNSTDELPVIMFFYGGGWILGNKFTHDYLARQLAHKSRVAVIIVNFTSSPEAQYPLAIEQAYAATNYIAHHGKKLNLDPTNIAAAGDSVAGNMTTIIAY